MSRTETTEEEWATKSPHSHHWGRRSRNMTNPGGGIYGLGFLGAFIYYLQHATSFGMGLLGIIKALFWPGFLVYHLMLWLKM